MSAKTQPSILAVDDTPANLSLLVGLMKDLGYRLRPVPSGDLALRAAAAEPPDLILLDISMPGMDGYEVCARLKEDPQLREIPVIFLTAHTETQDKVRAFAAGGVDYVSKPFQAEEIRARVATHLALARQKRELRESYEQLRALEKMRDDLVHMLVHDLRSPLTAMLTLLQLVQRSGQSGSADAQRDVAECLGATKRMMVMVTSMLDASKLEAGGMRLDRSSFDLGSLARDIVRGMGGLASGREVSVEAAAPVVVNADATLLGRVVQNLLANALRFTPRGGTIRIALSSGDRGARFAMSDEGPGVPEAMWSRIFEKFGAVSGPTPEGSYSTGLGLPFCKLAVELHGGAIGVESGPGQKGSVFWFTIPPFAGSPD
jgi:signal transduction histidine kinase